MCFSASASFGVSAVLIVAGVATVKKTRDSSFLPFALIPFIFGIQQFCEGILWLSLTNPDYAHFHLSTTYFFLIFAQVVWPAWVPFSIWQLEQNFIRKRILFYIMILGFLLSIYLAFCLWQYPVASQISDHHIRYDLDFQHNLIRYSGIFYFIPTVIPSLVSSRKYMSVFGLLVLASFIVSKIFFEEHVISVWCYFAAAISGLIYFLLKRFNHPV